MDLDGGATTRKTINDGPTFETALDWFHRSQRYERSNNKKRRRRNSSNQSSWSDDELPSDISDVNAATDPSMAAWRFLRCGKSGIAPIDAAWKRSYDTTNANNNNHRILQGQRGPRHPFSLPPVTVLEGPKDVGKTWMLLTLAARFVVATRASRFGDFGKTDEAETQPRDSMEHTEKGILDADSNNDDCDDDMRKNDDRPKVLFFDATYDFSLTQLVNVVRLTLLRDRQRQRARGIREPQPRGKQPKVTDDEVLHKNTGRGCNGDKHHHHQCDKGRTIEEELELQERERISLERDMEDCLSRIHLIQVDNGPTGWVPILEAVTYELSEERRLRQGCDYNSYSIPSDPDTFLAGPPTLLLWDGFLSDMALASNATMTPTTPVVLGDFVGNNNNVHALFDSPSVQELLRQISRLLQSESDTLWLVLTTRTVSVTAAAPMTNIASENYTHTTIENSGIGLRITEWVRKEEERRLKNHSGYIRDKQQRNPRPNKQHRQRASFRVRLERRCDNAEGRIPRTAAAAAALFARVLGCGDADFDSSNRFNGNHSTTSNAKIPYSISLGGILS